MMSRKGGEGEGHSMTPHQISHQSFDCLQASIPSPSHPVHTSRSHIPFTHTVHTSRVHCLQFEESLISAKMEQMADDEDAAEEEGGEPGDGENFLLTDDAKDIDLRWVFEEQGRALRVYVGGEVAIT